MIDADCCCNLISFALDAAAEDDVDTDEDVDFGDVDFGDVDFGDVDFGDVDPDASVDADFEIVVESCCGCG